MRNEKTGIQVKSHLIMLRSFSKCFTSKDIISWCQKNIEYFHDASSEEVSFFIQLLMDRKYVVNALDKQEEDFEDNTKNLYRFREVVPSHQIGIIFKKLNFRKRI